MQTITKILAVVLATLTGNMVMAQRVMNDPTYSINNYKHPNKAAYMKKQQDAQPVVYVEEIKDETSAPKANNSLTSSSNYKGMSAEKAKTKKFRASDSPSAKPFHLAPSYGGNYKQQFHPVNRTRKAEPKNEEQPASPVATN
jgi:hypothetical protein